MRNRFRFFLIIMLCVAVLGLLSCGPGRTSGRATPTPADRASPANHENKPADGRYIDHIFDDVTVEKNIPFGQAIDYRGVEQTLLLDVYMPQRDTETNRPAIIWVHGGGFTAGSKEGGFDVIMAEAFARKGYVCLSINYRLRNERYSDWPGTLSDAVADTGTALAWTIGHSAEYGIDPERIALSGYSAGGTTVTGLAYNDGIDLPDTASRSIWAIINMAGGAYGMGDISPGAPAASSSTALRMIRCLSWAAPSVPRRWPPPG